MNEKNISFILLGICFLVIIFMGVKLYLLGAEVSYLRMQPSTEVVYSSEQLHKEIASLRSRLSNLEKWLHDEKISLQSYDNKLMTAKELSEYLDVNNNSVYGELDSIPHISLDGEKRFLKSEVNKWIIENSTSEPTSLSKEIMNPGELSRYLGVTVKQAITWAKDESSGMPFYMSGTNYRFRKQDIDKWWNNR